MLSMYRFYLFFHVFNALYNFKNDDLKYITYFFICIMYIYMCTLLYNYKNEKKIRFWLNCFTFYLHANIDLHGHTIEEFLSFRSKGRHLPGLGGTSLAPHNTVAKKRILSRNTWYDTIIILGNNAK